MRIASGRFFIYNKIMDFLKKWFVPGQKNGYKPHLFSETGIGVLFSLIIFVFLIASLGNFIISRTGLTALVLPNVLVDEANSDRQALQYRELTINPILVRAAQLKANDMATKGYFAHQSPDGHSPWYWFSEAGYDFSYAGENLAVNFTDSSDVNAAWMNSPSHRANILNSNFTEIGIATAEGIYNGKATTFVVEMFGRPAFENLATNIALNAETKTKIATTTKIVRTSSVLGASEENDLYIAVKKESAATTFAENTNYSNWIGRLFSSPKRIMSFIYIVLAVLITIGLILMIVIEIKKQHPIYIMFGLGLLFLMLVLTYLYQNLLFGPLLIV